jgi:hypothetical protein
MPRFGLAVPSVVQPACLGTSFVSRTAPARFSFCILPPSQWGQMYCTCLCFGHTEFPVEEYWASTLPSDAQRHPQFLSETLDVAVLVDAQYSQLGSSGWERITPPATESARYRRLPSFCRSGVRETCGCRASHYSTLSAAPLSVRPAELSTHQSVLLRVEKSIQIDTLLPLLPFPVACASKRALRWIYSRRLRVSTLPLPADCKNLFVCRGAGQNKQASTGRTLPKRVIRTADVMCNTVIRCGARGGPVRCSGLLCTDCLANKFYRHEKSLRDRRGDQLIHIASRSCF